MRNGQMAEVGRVLVKERTLRETIAVLQKFGATGCEGLVLWAGSIAENTAEITRVIVPPQRPIRSDEGVGYFLEAEALFALNRELSESGERLVAQIHSHPREAFHSRIDDRYAIVTEAGGLSLVVPDFGAAPPDPSAWAVYRLGNAAWRVLSADAVKALIHVINE